MRDSKRDTDVYNSLLDSAGEVGMVWENGIEMCSGLVHWNDPEGWYGDGRGRGSGWGTPVHPWRIHVDVWQNQYNVVK